MCDSHNKNPHHHHQALKECDRIAELYDADDSIQNIVNQLKHEVEEKLGKKLEHLKAIQYRVKMADGVVYLVKCKVTAFHHPNHSEYIHVRIVEALNEDLALNRAENKPHLSFVLGGKTLEDDLCI